MKYLDHIISAAGATTDSEKIQKPSDLGWSRKANTDFVAFWDYAPTTEDLSKDLPTSDA